MTPTSKKDPFTRLFTLVLCIFGTVFFLAGIGLIIREYTFGKVALSSTCSIVDVQVTQNADGPNYTPIVEFRTSEGETIRFEGLSTSPPPVKGTIVPVLYRPTSPKDARINTFINRWLFPTIFTPLGVSMFVVGCWYRMVRRSQPESNLFDDPNTGTSH